MFKYTAMKLKKIDILMKEGERENKLTMSHSALLTSLRFLVCLAFHQSLL